MGVAWSPQPGSQQMFLASPFHETLYEGTRGPGKTDALIMDFAQHVGCGHGAEWRGILFRQSFPQLADVVKKTHRWFKAIFPRAKFNKSTYTWVFPDGEALLLRYIDNPDDYWNYHGHEYPWIGWEELTNWPTIECYDAMKSCCRSSCHGLPRKIRATCNPYGIGHQWVKAYYIDPAPAGVPITDERTGQKRVRLFGSVRENKILLAADPEYIKRIMAITNENMRKAWLYGSWDIVAGSFFAEEWRHNSHVLKPFPIPASWRIDRSFDWGSSKPYSVGWWAESDGTQATLADGTRKTFPRGSLFRIAELYGWNGTPNEGTRELAVDVARKILEAEKAMLSSPYFGAARRIYPGPADTSIYDVENGNSIADDMQKGGVTWERADKSPGSRKHGWERMRKYLKAAREGSKDEPGLYVFDTCRHFVRTIPALPMDERKLDDIDSAAEDHVADETRYKILSAKREAKPFSPMG